MATLSKLLWLQPQAFHCVESCHHLAVAARQVLRLRSLFDIDSIMGSRSMRLWYSEPSSVANASDWRK